MNLLKILKLNKSKIKENKNESFEKKIDLRFIIVQLINNLSHIIFNFFIK